MFLFTTFGEWLETNALGIIIAVVSWFGTVAAIAWKMSDIASTARSSKIAADDLREDFDSHKLDASVHTTFEFRQSVNSRLDRIEDEVKGGHDRIEAKIDRWAERIMAKN